MRKPKVQQRTERRISAALRLVMVAVLLLAQIALVVGLSDLLKQRMALAYTVLQLLAGVVAMRIWARPGATSYKMGWIILVLFVPVVGLILYLLWNGDSGTPWPPISTERDSRSTGTRSCTICPPARHTSTTC